MNKFKYVLILLLFLLPAVGGYAAVPLLLNYQGNVKDGAGVPVNGLAYFKFAIVNQAGDTAYWVNNGTTLDGSEPPASVAIAVTDGVFSVKLGDISLTNMAALTQSVFDNDNIYLRVWISTDNLNFEKFVSDIQIVSTGFAFKAAVADTVKDSAVTSVTIQDNSITNADISTSAAISASKIDRTDLNADTLDGIDSSGFALAGHVHNYAGSTTPGGPATDLDCTTCVSSSEIDRTGLDADTLDGNDSSAFALANHNHDSVYVSKTNPTFSPQTGYAAVPPQAFHPTNNTYAYHYDGWSLFNDGGATNNVYYAPVYLPHGATITSMTIRYVDNSANDMTVSLCKHTGGNAINCVFLVASSSGTSTTWGTATASCTSSCTVDNTNSDYYLNLNMPDASIMRFAGAKIEYQYTTP